MTDKPIVLLVDDEPSMLESLKLTQSKRYDIRTATSGAEGLAQLRETPDLAVVISDMRMPEMDGATFLAAVKTERPDVVRLLLTGHADVESAARAVNEGRIFRYLTKPTDPATMAESLAAAVDLHRAFTAERVLLQKTLVGTVKALVNVLGLASPEAMGRAVRVRERSRKVAEKLGLGDHWGVEFAAVLSQLTPALLSDSTAKKLYAGKSLSGSEQGELLAGMRSIADLLREIPRLDAVTDTLDALVELTDGKTPVEKRADGAAADARMLRAIIDLDAIESTGLTPAQALAELDKSRHRYDPNALTALAAVINDSSALDEGVCPVTALADGMVLAEDLKTKDGLLLLPRGFELTRSSREHILKRFARHLPERVRVHVPAAREKKA